MSLLTLGKINEILTRLTATRAGGLDNVVGSTTLDNLAATLSAADLDNLANLDAAVSTLGGQLTREEITSSQTLTAPDNATWARVILVGGGAGGYPNSAGMDGPGGEGGEIIESTVAVTGGGSYPVVIGAGGNVGSSNAGGNTTGFGLTARGGRIWTQIEADRWAEDSRLFFERYMGGGPGGGEHTGVSTGTVTKGGDSRGLGGAAYISGGAEAGGGGGSWGNGGTCNGAGPTANGGGGGAGGTSASGGVSPQAGAAGRLIVEWLE